MNTATIPADFNEKLEAFRKGAEEKLQAHVKGIAPNFYKDQPLPRITIMEGPRYIRLVLDEGERNRSCWGFIDKTNGDILKSSGWKAPAKHARGNIFDENPVSKVGPYGPAYLK